MPTLAGGSSIAEKSANAKKMARKALKTAKAAQAAAAAAQSDADDAKGRTVRVSFLAPTGTAEQQAGVDRAARLARMSERSLAEVTADAGFADQAHMTRAFKRYYGRTPNAIRRDR